MESSGHMGSSIDGRSPKADVRVVFLFRHIYKVFMVSMFCHTYPKSNCATKGMVSTESSVLMKVISVMSAVSRPYLRQRMVP